MSDYELKAVFTFRIGEGDDDLRNAFYIDGREYSDAAAVRADIAAASTALENLKLVYESESSDAGSYTTRPNVPDWPQWRQRHLLDGEPIGVRPRTEPFRSPSEWPSMFAWLDESHRWLCDQMDRIAGAVDGARVSIEHDYGPRRFGRASVVPSEERYFVDRMVRIVPPDGTEAAALEAITGRMRAEGWTVGAPAESATGLTITGRQRDHEMAVVRRYGRRGLGLTGRSPVVDATFFAADPPSEPAVPPGPGASPEPMASTGGTAASGGIVPDGSPIGGSPPYSATAGGAVDGDGPVPA